VFLPAGRRFSPGLGPMFLGPLARHCQPNRPSVPRRPPASRFQLGLMGPDRCVGDCWGAAARSVTQTTAACQGPRWACAPSSLHALMDRRPVSCRAGSSADFNRPPMACARSLRLGRAFRPPTKDLFALARVCQFPADSDVRGSVTLRPHGSPSYKRSIRLMRDQLIHLSVRSDVEFHSKAF
jgi:hypothetical protein